MDEGIIEAQLQEKQSNPEECKIASISFVRDKIPRYDENSSNNYMFVIVTEQGIEIRTKPKQLFFVHNTELYKSYLFDEIHDFQCRVKRDKNLYAGAVYWKPDSQLFIVKFASEEGMNNFDRKMKERLSEERRVQKSEFSYLPIEQGLRDAVEKCVLKSKAKWFLLTEVNQKLREKKRENLDPEIYRQMVMGLVEDEQELRMILRKEKIQAYDIEKKYYVEGLKASTSSLRNGGTAIFPSSDNVSASNSLNNAALTNQQGGGSQIEGYTRKKQMEGIIKLHKPELELSSRVQEQLCLDQIPDYSDHSIDQLLGHMGGMDIELNQNPQITHRKQMNPMCTTIRIPTHQSYSILMKEQIKEQRSIVKLRQGNEFKTECAVEAVKFMYKLMKLHHHQSATQSAEAYEQILKCLRDVLTDLQKDVDYGNKYVVDFIEQASHNYMQHRGKKLKIYD